MTCALNASRQDLWRDSLLIVLSLATLLVLILILALCGAGVGFSIWPLGEDNNWVDLLQRHSGASIARAFWAIDHRNPLSPWWYIASKPIILGFDAGLLALRYAIALVLALSTYAMIVAIAGASARLFALAVSIVIVVWMANRYLDQIFWNFQGALAATIISVAAFARSLEGGRYARELYALSIVAWFIAFATYTIQCGAIIAMAYLSIRRTTHGTDQPRSTQLLQTLWRAGFSVLPHLMLFVLFILIWETTINAGAISIFSLNFDFLRVFASIREGLLIADFHLFFRRLTDSPTWLVFGVASTLAGGMVFVLLRARAQSLPINRPIAPLKGTIDFLVITACIALPTVLLEAGSPIWTPGTRWPMIYQFSTPAVLVGGSTFLVLLVVRTRPKQGSYWAAVIGLISGIGVLFSLAQNRFQNDTTRFERFVRNALERTIAEDFLLGREPPIQLLLLISSHSLEKWRALDTMGPTLSRVWFGRSDVSFRLIPRTPAPIAAFASWWTVGFGSDADGVHNAKVWGGTVPYSQVIALRIDDTGAHRISELTREDLAHWSVAWNRQTSVIFHEVDKTKLCPMRWSPDMPILGRGWGPPERGPAGRSFRWTTSRTAILAMPNSCGRPTAVRVEVISALSTRSLEELRVTLNGLLLTTHRQQGAGGMIYEAEVPTILSTDGPILRIALEVNTLDRIPDAGRDFGVAVGSIEIVPTAGARGTD